MSPSRVNYDDLELDDQFAVLNGAAYTGIVYSERPDGSLEFQGLYVDGLPDGIQEEWYPSGQTERRWIAVRGQGVSESWSWHDNGQLSSYRRNADNQPVELKAWDRDGNEINFATLTS